jgi:catechol 2,3-dioxygenase-like lactoylglutathione lyase family enzyme
MAEGPAIFRQLHHVCIVVHDIARTEAFYTSQGVGPWLDYPPLDQYTELQTPSREGFLAMRYRFCDIDNIQLQLCQPPNTPCPQRRFLDEKGEGVFHLGFAVPDCDAAEATARAAGLEVLMRGRREDDSGFTYFDTAGDAGVCLEIRRGAQQ